MLKRVASAVVLLFVVTSALAAEPALVCFGNEPSWSLSFNGRGGAQLGFPGQPDRTLQGRETRLDLLNERVWRSQGRASGTVVAFLRESACSDNMSDIRHPMSARVSLPDGRLLAGCCRVPASQNVPAAGGGNPVAIEGTVWRLAGLPQHDAATLAALSRPVTIRLQAGRIDGFTGCNQLAGSYTIADDRLIPGPLLGTLMVCEPAISAIDNAVRGALSGPLRWSVAGDQLTLTPMASSAGASAPLIFRAEAPPMLTGVTWTVTGFNNGRQAVVSTLSGTTLTLSFGADRVEGHAGCNRFGGKYTSQGDAVTIGPLVGTRMACSGDGVMQQEREFLAALQSATRWSVRGGMLDMHRGDGERVLTASDKRR